MNRTDSAPQGIKFLSDNILQVENAIIEEVVENTETTGSVMDDCI